MLGAVYCTLLPCALITCAVMRLDGRFADPAKSMLSGACRRLSWKPPGAAPLTVVLSRAFRGWLVQPISVACAPATSNGSPASIVFTFGPPGSDVTSIWSLVMACVLHRPPQGIKENPSPLTAERMAM